MCADVPEPSFIKLERSRDQSFGAVDILRIGQWSD
jgi:hypothetical protein